VQSKLPKAVVKALHCLSSTSSECIDTLAVDVTKPASSLEKSDDITQLLLTRPQPIGPSLPSSSICILKAAAVSFQTWALRYYGLVGIILGSKDKNRITASSIIVDYSFNKLMNDEKIKLVNESHNLFICGIAMSGHLTDDSQVRDQFLNDIVASGQQYATCLLAPYLNYL